MIKTYSTHLPLHYVDLVKRYLQALQVKYSTMECDKLLYIELEIEENSNFRDRIDNFITSLATFEYRVKKNG